MIRCISSAQRLINIEECPALFYFLLSGNHKESQSHPRGPAEEVQQYVKNGSRAIRGRVFPEYVCIEDVDKIISSVQRAPAEAAGRVSLQENI